MTFALSSPSTIFTPGTIWHLLIKSFWKTCVWLLTEVRVWWKLLSACSETESAYTWCTHHRCPFSFCDGYEASGLIYRLAVLHEGGNGKKKRNRIRDVGSAFVWVGNQNAPGCWLLVTPCDFCFFSCFFPVLIFLMKNCCSFLFCWNTFLRMLFMYSMFKKHVSLRFKCVFQGKSTFFLFVWTFFTF